MSSYIKCLNLSKLYHLSGNTNLEQSQTGILGENRIKDNKLFALDDVSFYLNEGDKLGVIGMNGAGKSTLLKIISGLLKPSSGRIEISGNITALIEQTSLLFPEMTGIENIFLQGSLLGYNNDFIQSKVASIIEYSGLQQYINEPVKNYSSGMSLRLSFALINELAPEILVLDEALSPSDKEFRQQATLSINELFKKSKIVILASHQMEEIASLCNKCMILNQGKVSFFGDIESAISLYFSQSKMANLAEENNLFSVTEISFSTNKSIFHTGEKIGINISYINNLSDEEILPLINITGSFGPVLTDSPLYRKDFTNYKISNGSCTCYIEIPSDLINIGKYIISFTFGNSKEIFLQMDNVLSFNIIPNEWEKSKPWVSMEYNFPVRFPLKWNFETKKSKPDTLYSATT